MNAEILCVGTELLLGDIVNTNAGFLARQLAALGIGVYFQSVVGDNPGRLKESLQLALSRNDMVILTGGLGPTYDDLTKETAAALFGRKLQMHQPSLERIEHYFARTGREMTENNKKQALMPQGAVVFQNNYGTAPGLAIEDETAKKVVILLPGPPREMEPMFLEEVRPYLKKFCDHTLVSTTLYIFGMGESQVETLLRDMMVGSQNPTVAPYAKSGEVQLRVTASAADEVTARKMIAPVVAQIEQRLGDVIYGVGVGSLQNALVQELMQKHLKVAAAESCSGGLVSKRITEIPGSSAVFDCAVCSYSNEIKHRLLKVKQETLQQFGAVSEQTAAEMAKGIRELSGADIGVSVTGIAGPDGGSEEKPVGLVYVGVDSPWYSEVKKLMLGRGNQKEREYIRILASSHALYLALQAARRATI